jgi:monoamine oxidase
MGLLNKCWLRFDRIAWPDDVDWIEWLGPKDGHFSQWVSLANAAGLPVLLAFHAGQAGREIEALSDAALQAEAHDALKAMFGSAFPAPVASQTTRWAQDPLALGSYSFNAVGVTAKTRKALAGSDWEGRLIFAGEAASPRHFGTAHGAVLSGRAAADALLN